MRTLRRLWNRTLGTLGFRNPDAQLDDELAAHLDLLTDENIRAGMEPTEARRQARLKLGATSAIQQDYRTQRGLPRLEIFLNDLRQAARALRNAPAFTIAVVLTLGVAIGANTAIFSLVNQALFNLRGVYRADRVVSVRETFKKLNLIDIPGTSGPSFADIRNARDIFQYAAAVTNSSFALNGTGAPQHLNAGNVTYDWFNVLGVKPILGRTFTPEEDQPNAPRVVVLSSVVWNKNFGADPNVIGRTIELDLQPYHVIGVMPAGIEWMFKTDIWIPLALKPEIFDDSKERFHEYLLVMARLRDGVTQEQAAAWMSLLTNRVLESSHPDAAEVRKVDWSIFAKPLADLFVGDTRTPMLFLLAAVGLVLLIAASNVAGLMLARNSARAHELAVQAALGASRARILSRTFAESLVLAALGTTLGLALAIGAMKVLLLWIPQGYSGLAVQLDAPTLAFTAITVAAAGLLFGLVPAWYASKAMPFGAMKSAGRTTSRQRLRSTLVIAETALALVLIVAAAALLRSFTKLEQVNPGFSPAGVTTAFVSFPDSRYNPEKQIAFYTGVLDHLPPSSAMASSIPFQEGELDAGSFNIKGRPTQGVTTPHGDRREVSPGFFELLKIPVRAGRAFTKDDRLDTQPVAVIDEQLARQYWPNEDPIGQQIRTTAENAPWFTVVGVVGHIAHSELTSFNSRGTLYFALNQSRRTPTAAIATQAPIESIRAAVAAVDPSQAVYDIESLENRVADSLADRRFILRTMSFFALTALLLAALGLYGVIGYAVTQRTRELGVRFALGARTSSIVAMVVKDGLRLAIIGAAIGLAATAGLAKYFDAQLYESSTLDTPNLISAAIILLGVATIASLLPARRAASVDPLSALRCE